MKILGIDPGSTRVGYGLIKAERGNLKFIRAGLLKINPLRQSADGGKNLSQRLMSLKLKRLLDLEKSFSQLLKKEKPNLVALEKLYFVKNQKTALAVAEAKGVLMLCAQKTGQPVFYYTPLQIKQAVVGYGRADKKQVQQMIKIILKLKAAPRPDDAADAVATAVCCAHSENFDALPRPHAS